MSNDAMIDFSGIDSIREPVTLRLPDGEIVTLPLIILRDAPKAVSFLRENDVITVKYELVMTKLAQRSEGMADAIEESKDTVLDAKEIEVLEATANNTIEMHRELRGIYNEISILCDEIHNFMRQYFEDDRVINCLKQNDNRYTIKVLQLMLLGKVATDKDGGDSPENPTTPPSETN